MNFINKYKKLLICLLIGIVLGFSGGANTSVSKAEVNTLLTQKESVEEKISSVDSLIEKESKNIELLETQKLSKEESIRVEKEKEEEKSRLEAERLANEQAKKEAEARESKHTNSNTYTSAEKDSSSKSSNDSSSESNTKVEGMVWLSATGEKYHNKNNCGRMNPNKARQVDISDAKSRGFEACKKCY